MDGDRRRFVIHGTFLALALLLAPAGVAAPGSDLPRLAQASTDQRAAPVGIRVFTPSKEEAEKFGLEPGVGVIVVELNPGGAAEAAGLKIGDALVTFNGRGVESGHDLQRYIREVRPGETVDMTVLRAGQRLTLKLTVRPLGAP